MILNGFLNQLKNKSFLTVRFVFLFFLFFNMLILSNPTSAQGLELVIGHYDCTSNSQCNENQYCDIDSHVCIDKNPEPACNADLCNLDEICPVTEPTIVETCPDTCADDEYFSLSEKKCVKREANCNYVLEEKCIECLDDSDCAGKQCDLETHTCKDFIQCNPTSGKVLVDGKCACRGNMTENEFGVCVCENMPEGGNPDTCDCGNDKDNVNGKCLPMCPTSSEIKGMSGMRNAAGQCLCNTTEHYQEIAIQEGNTYRCECIGDVDNDTTYVKDPTGACMKCSRQKASTIVDEFGGYEGVDETVWQCPYYKIEKRNITFWPKYFNQTTKEYCKHMQVLRRNSSGGFECQYCENESKTVITEDGPLTYGGESWILKEGNGADLLENISNRNTKWSSRSTAWGGCFCMNYTKFNTQVGLCENKCINSIFYASTNKCEDCRRTDMLTKSGCVRFHENKNKYCWNDLLSGAAGSGTFNYGPWQEKSQAAGCNSPYVALVPKSDKENGKCSYEYGCRLSENNLPPCPYDNETNDVKITSDCTCNTNSSAKVGGYCCEKNAYATTRGCITCPVGEVVNAAKNGCEKCPQSQIVKNGLCESCPQSYYPNEAQTRCLLCPNGKVQNSAGIGCVCPTGTTEDPLTDTCVEKTL